MLTRRLWVSKPALSRHAVNLERIIDGSLPVRRRVVTTPTFPVMNETILQGIRVGTFWERSARHETGPADGVIKEPSRAVIASMVIPRARLEHWLAQFSNCV